MSSKSASKGGSSEADVQATIDDLKGKDDVWFVLYNPAAVDQTASDTSDASDKSDAAKKSNAAVEPKRNLDVQLMHTLIHDSVICCVRFSSDGKYLAAGCNRKAYIYDTKTGAEICVLTDDAWTGDLYVRSVCFSPDGKYLVTGSEDNKVRVWDIAKRKIRDVFEGHTQEIYSVDYSNDNRLVVSGSGDRTVRIWDTQDETQHRVLNITETDNIDADITSVRFSPDGSLVAAGSLDNIIRIWDVQTDQLIEILRGHKDSTYSVAFIPDGLGLVSGSLDKTLKNWDLETLLSDGSADLEDGDTASLTQSPCALGLTGLGESGEKAQGRIESGGLCTMDFVGHTDFVLSVAVSHDGRWVVSGSKDCGAHFWDIKSGVVQCRIQAHESSVISVDLSPVGSILATGSGDWRVRIWSYSAK